MLAARWPGRRAGDRPGRHDVTAVLSGPAAWLVSRHGCLFAAGAAIVTLVVFRLDPGLDLAATSLFYAGHNHFVGQTRSGDVLRRLLADAPLLVAAIMLLLFAARRLGARHFWAPRGRALAFLALSLAIGPGLLVNLVLKDHSHRPRPVQTEVFGGTMPFRPVGSFDGACASNCSFVSGEGASAFWTLAPALLAPAAVQPLAIGAALCLGSAASLLRIAFGGHYLSDTVMAALLVWLVIAGCWRLVMRP